MNWNTVVGFSAGVLLWAFLRNSAQATRFHNGMKLGSSFAMLCFAILLLSMQSSARGNELFNQVESELIVTNYASNGRQIQFSWPTHIAFGPGKQEIVTDLKNSRLVFRKNENEAFQVSPVVLHGPHSVVYNPNDRLYYVNDTENNRIIAFADLHSKTITSETKSIAGIPLVRPHDIVMDQVNGWLYAINPNSGHIFRFTSIGSNESAIKVPVQGYARALTFSKGRVYVIGSARGRIVEIVDWDASKFNVYDSLDPTGKQGPAGSWSKTGLVLNDAEFFDGFWYATNYFTKSYSEGSNADENRFIRFKTLSDLVTGKWTDLSSLIPPGMTPYYLSLKDKSLFLAMFNHESPGNGDGVLKFTTVRQRN